MYEFALDIGEMTPTVKTMMSMIDTTKALEALKGKFLVTKKTSKGTTLYYRGFMRGFTSNVLYAKSYDSKAEAKTTTNRVLSSCSITSVTKQFISEEVSKIWNNI